MDRWIRLRPARYALTGLLILCSHAAPSLSQDTTWLPTPATHAWARFGVRAWKEVRLRTSIYDENEEVIRSSVSVIRTRVIRVARRSISLCISNTVQVAGREFCSELEEITRDLAPELESSEVMGTETVEIDGQLYSVQVIQLVTKSGTRRDTSYMYHCEGTKPRVLKRITTTVDIDAPDATTTTTVNVTDLNKRIDILGETKCSWCITTKIETDDRTVMIEEVHCQDVPGELVAQVTEERNKEGRLVSRKELELVGYGHGRQRRIFWRRQQ